jgi:hypothetical protein
MQDRCLKNYYDHHMRETLSENIYYKLLLSLLKTNISLVIPIQKFIMNTLALYMCKLCQKL